MIILRDVLRPEYSIMHKKMIIADVGGTNGRFAIAKFKNPSDAPNISDIRVFSCPDYASFDAMMKAYIDTLSEDIPNCAQLAIAGEMTPRHGNLWHFNWNISASDLEEKFNLKRVTLMNDYEAMVRSIPYLNSEDFFNITDFEEGLIDGPYTVFGVGSGLGGSIAKPSINGLEVVSTEIGHVSFAPKTDLEIELLNFTKKTVKNISNESYLSGPGLKRIHHFVNAIGANAGRNMTPSEITTAALNKTDNDCIKTVEIFLDILASVAGDIALSQGSRGGVYISGGIVPRLINVIDRDRFSKRFNNKGPMKDYVRKIPVKVIMSDMPALFGAACEVG